MPLTQELTKTCKHCHKIIATPNTGESYSGDFCECQLDKKLTPEEITRSYNNTFENVEGTVKIIDKDGKKSIAFTYLKPYLIQWAMDIQNGIINEDDSDFCVTLEVKVPSKIVPDSMKGDW